MLLKFPRPFIRILHASLEASAVYVLFFTCTVLSSLFVEFLTTKHNLTFMKCLTMLSYSVYYKALVALFCTVKYSHG